MVTSEALLTGIAVRLAALVVAGFVAKAGVKDSRRQEIACIGECNGVAMLTASMRTPAADDIKREMRLYD
jgi:hypothetical protein